MTSAHRWPMRRILAALSRGHQPYPRDLRRYAQALGRAPVAAAAAGVDPQAPEPVKARRKRLLQPHEEIPRPELAAMRVARQLQVEAGVRGRRCRARLMCEE